MSYSPGEPVASRSVGRVMIGSLRSRGGIFISYRREDTGPTAGRLHDHLSRRFKDQVFMDVDSIAIGHDFSKALIDALSKCNMLLVLIGHDWISITDGDERRRIDNPGDWVRVEIETALKRNIQVVPVLVDGADLPQADDLPLSLQPLTQRQIFRLNNTISFRSDIASLIAAARKARSSRSTEAPKVASREAVTEQGVWQLELVTDRRFMKTFRLSSGTEAHRITVRIGLITHSIKVDEKSAVRVTSPLHGKQFYLPKLSSTLGCAVTIMVSHKTLPLLRQINFLLPEVDRLDLRISNQVLTWKSGNH